MGEPKENIGPLTVESLLAVARARRCSLSGVSSTFFGPGKHPVRKPTNPAPLRGLASGLVNTSLQLGGALGLAVFTAVAASVGGPNPDLTELTGGYQAAFRWSLLLPAGSPVTGRAWPT